MKKVPTKLPAISSALGQQLSHRFAQIFAEVHQRAEQRVFALGQKLRCFTEYVGIVAGQAQRLRLQEWVTQKKPGWYAVYANRQMPRTTTWVDQAHNTLDRKLFMMKGFHHPLNSGESGYNSAVPHSYPYQFISTFYAAGWRRLMAYAHHVRGGTW
jgi:hypothetical protein